MQPIIVRPSTEAGNTKSSPANAVGALSKIAGLSEVPVIIREIPDRQALELALVENVQRQDLSPLEEAGGYQRLINEFDYTQDELASTIGKSRSHVANFLRLLSLPEEIKEMLDKGELSMGHARALLNAPNAVELARAIVRKGLTVQARPRSWDKTRKAARKKMRRVCGPALFIPPLRPTRIPIFWHWKKPCRKT